MYFEFEGKVESAIRIRKQNCMGLKSSLDVDALVDDIDKAIDEALQQREAEVVMGWMRDLGKQEFIPSVIEEKILSKGMKRCFGWCPNLKSHYLHIMGADKYVHDVPELLKKIWRTHEGALSKTQQKVAAAAVKDFMYFDSRRDASEEIMVALQSPRISSIGVHGEAGVGKTMLVEEIRRKAEQLKLFDDVVMAKVTNNPDMRRIQDDIAHDLGLELPDDRVAAAVRIKSRLTDRKVLVILDDIWERIDLEEVGIPFGNKHKQRLKHPIEKKNEEISSVEEQTKCIVLLTSRDSGVLSRDMHAHKIIEVGPLTECDAWKLFVMTAGEQAKKRIFQRTAKIDKMIAGEQPIAEIGEVVKKCKQLPVAIATLASILKDKSPIQWRTAIKKLRGRLNILYSAIKLSYDDLESKQLKQTLLLCSLMGHNSGLQDLLKYVIGLELFQARANSIEAARDEAVILVKKLRDSFLLLDGGSNMHFDMHDPIREVTISIASEDPDVLVLREDAAKENLDRDKLKIFKWIYLSNVDASQLLNRLKCPQLTFFHLANKDLDMEIPDNFFKGAKGLRVLGLTRMHFSSFPSSISLLVNLRTLRLDQSVLGTDLGSIMGNLKNLQVLSLVECDIKELPQETKELGKLKLLDLSDCTKLILIPPDVLKSLSQLEGLYMRNSFDQWEDIKKHDRRRNASLDELTQLGNLTSLEVHIHDINMIPDDLFSMELKRYKIFIGDVWNHWGSSFEHSKTLKLKHDGRIRSDKVKKLPNKVEELHLEELNGVKYVFNELDQNGFQELKCLHVKNIDLEIEHLFYNPKKEIYSEVLPKLEVLFLHNLKGLKKIFQGLFEKTSLEMLRIITVTCCNRLKNLFSFSVAKQLLYLQEIRVIDCSNIVEIVNDEEEEDANDITAEATDDVINKLVAKIQCLRLQHLTEFVSFSQENIIISSNTSLFNKKLVTGCGMWNLTKLIIEGCDQLENLFFEYIPDCVEKLEHLEIRECKKMREIFVRAGGWRRLRFPSLKLLAIENCPELKGFVGDEGADKSITGTALFNVTVRFPTLETMSISNLKSLNIIWWEFDSFYFDRLNFLLIKDLPDLIRLCQKIEYGRFYWLEQLTIENCPQLNGSLFDEKFKFPELKIMTISHLNNLEIIWKNLAEDSFRKLRSLRVTYCQKLSTIFSYNSGMLKKLLGSLKQIEIIGCSSVKQVFELGQANITEQAQEAEEQTLIFEQLKFITIADCPNMVTFASTFPRDQEQETSESCFSTKVEFPNLQSLVMEDCHGFKYLMTLSTVQSFSLLKELVIRGCKNMEEVIVTEEFTENRISLFPELNSMELEDLPELTRFCSEPQNLQANILFLFPKVANLKFSKLPKLASFLPKYATEWPELTSIHVRECDQVQIFALEFPSGDNQIESRTQQHPLFWVSKELEGQEGSSSSSPIDMNQQGLEGQEGSSSSSTIDMPAVSFVKLRTLEVSKCHGLITILRYTMAKRLDQLSTMSIIDCSKLKEVFELGQSDSTRQIEEAEEYKLIFQQLEVITIADCPNMVTFASNFSRDQDQETSEPFFSTKVEFPKLELLVMKDCPGFKYLMTLSSVQSFSQLEELVIRGCKKMEEVIVTEEFAEENMITLFPKLSSMELEDLPELTRFSEPQNLLATTLFVFPKVTNLKLSKLPNLESFLPKNATEWPELTSLHVCGCDQVQIFALEFPSGDNQIESMTQQHPLFWIKKGLEGQEGSSRSSTIDMNQQGLEGLESSSRSSTRDMPAVSFVKLRTLEVSRCHGLITILRYTMAKRMDQLSTMSITDCSKLEEIVACEGNELKDEIVFTQLTSLRLGLLPRLESFCSGKCNFSFPSLHEVILSECPEMNTFSKGVVKIEKLQKVKLTEEDDVGIWKDGDLNSSIQHLFINKEKKRGENAPVVAHDTQEPASKRGEFDLPSKEEKRGEDAPVVAHDAQEPASKRGEDAPTVADDAQEPTSKRGEFDLSSKEKKSGEDAHVVAHDAQESASKRGEDAPIVSQDAQELDGKRGEDAPTECIVNAASLLGNYIIKEVNKESSKSIGLDMMLLEKSSELDSALSKIEGLTEDERDITLSKLPDHPRQMVVFFNLSPDRRLAWVRRFLMYH